VGGEDVSKSSVPKTGDRREDLLREAAILFAEKGYEGTSVRDIADAVDLMPGSLYSHIAGKEDLLAEVLERCTGRSVELLEEAIAMDASFAVRFRAALLAILDDAKNMGRARPVVFECRALSPRRREPIVRNLRRYDELWEELFRTGIRSKELRNIDAKLARIILVKFDHWVYASYDPSGPYSAEEFVDRLADLLLNGLLQDSSHAHQMPAKPSKRVRAVPSTV
jgi:AcrR family transcriptional regulator